MTPPIPKNLINPNSVFKWEDSAGLEHACWACPTKANSPRALNSCYGIHSMPCASYHPTMHAIGGAHRCAACSMAKEMHEHRHREIAELVSEYHSVDTAAAGSHQSPLSERSPNLHNRPANLRIMAPLRANVLRNVDSAEMGDGENTDDDDSISIASSDSCAPVCAEEQTIKPTKAEQRVKKKAKKLQRNQNKAIKNQCRQLATVTSADIENVSRILHGDTDAEASSHPLATDKTIEDVIARNLSFVKHIQNHKQYLYKSVADGRKEHKERKRLKRREQKGEYEDIETEEVVNAILVKFGIDVSFSSAVPSISNTTLSVPTHNTRRKRASSAANTPSLTPRSASITKSKTHILQKLHHAIRDDLEKHENEVRGTYQRAGGFWRYVGKAVFDRMTEIAREVDVSTGENWEKKIKREAHLKAQQGDDDDDIAAATAAAVE